VVIVMKHIRLLVVDDDARVRRGLRMRLASEPDVEVVGEAGDGLTALRLAHALRPDVVLMDLLLPVMDGIQAIRELQRSAPACRVVAFSVRDNATTQQEAEMAGAATFVAKQEGPDLLLAVIRRVARYPQGDSHDDPHDLLL
jgi:DNA-binding NarL/FixJ family response regulator